MARKHTRTTARKCAAQILYASDLRKEEPSELLKNEELDCLEVPLSEYAEKLVEGVCEHQGELDEQIAAISENWSMDRMSIMDRAIMRIALYEMLYVEDVPISVSINEAVELAKGFGSTDDSPRFVNGMLGTLSRNIDETAEIVETVGEEQGEA